MKINAKGPNYLGNLVSCSYQWLGQQGGWISIILLYTTNLFIYRASVQGIWTALGPQMNWVWKARGRNGLKCCPPPPPAAGDSDHNQSSKQLLRSESVTATGMHTGFPLTTSTVKHPPGNLVTTPQAAPAIPNLSYRKLQQDVWEPLKTSSSTTLSVL